MYLDYVNDRAARKEMKTIAKIILVAASVGVVWLPVASVGIGAWQVPEPPFSLHIFSSVTNSFNVM